MTNPVRTPAGSPPDTYTLHSAECDPATGTIVLRVRGQRPIHLAVTATALRELKAAVQDCSDCATRQQRPVSDAG